MEATKKKENVRKRKEGVQVIKGDEREEERNEEGKRNGTYNKYIEERRRNIEREQ